MNLAAGCQKNAAGVSIIPAIGLLVSGWTRICTAERRPTDTVRPLKRGFSALAIFAWEGMGAALIVMPSRVVLLPDMIDEGHKTGKIHRQAAARNHPEL